MKNLDRTIKVSDSPRIRGREVRGAPAGAWSGAGGAGGGDASFANTSCLDRFMSKLTFNVGNVKSFNVIPICKLSAIFPRYFECAELLMRCFTSSNRTTVYNVFHLVQVLMQ